VYEGGTTTVTWTSTGQYCEASPNPFGLAETLPRHGTKIIGPIASSSPISFTCYTEAAGGLRALYSKSIFIVDPMTVPVTSSIPDCTDVLDRSICFSSNGMLRVPSLYIQSPDTLSKCTDALGSGTMCIDVNDNVHIPIASSPTPGATLSRCSSMATGTYACVDINSKVHLPVSTTSTSIAKCEDAFGQKSICVDGIGGIQFSATLIPTSYSPTSGCKVLGGKATCLNAPVLPGINIPIPLFPKIWGASTVCTDIASNIHRGSEGEETKKLQTFLMTIGLLDESPTAFYGDKTVQAVKEYQSSRGLPNTGMVYDFTRALIKKESCGE
jgi:hypothetical protein